jgi:hypothetical protein
MGLPCSERNPYIVQQSCAHRAFFLAKFSVYSVDLDSLGILWHLGSLYRMWLPVDFFTLYYYY